MILKFVRVTKAERQKFEAAATFMKTDMKKIPTWILVSGVEMYSGRRTIGGSLPMGDTLTDAQVIPALRTKLGEEEGKRFTERERAMYERSLKERMVASNPERYKQTPTGQRHANKSRTGKS